MLQASLKNKTVSGIKWQLISRISQKAISVVSFAILARILNPSIFGLFAMAFILIDGLHLLKGLGFDSALIQRKDRVEDAANTANFIVQIQGIVLASVCFLSAPLFAYAFGKPEVKPIVQALSSIFVLVSFSKIPTTLLIKQMKFNQLAMIELAGAIVNSVSAVLLVLKWPSVWSLVIAYLLKQLTICVLARFFTGYRFKLQFDWGIAKELFNFGKFTIGLIPLSYLTLNINPIVIGKFLGAKALGIYVLAANIGEFINNHFVGLVAMALFPAYSSIQESKEALRSVYLKTIRFVFLLTVPFSLCLILLANEFVLTLYGSKWVEAIYLIQLFGFMQLMTPIQHSSRPIFMGTGNPKYVFYLSALTLVIRIPILIWMVQSYGIPGAIYAVMIATALTFPIHIVIVNKIIKFKYLDFVKQFTPSFASGVAMFSVVSLAKIIIPVQSIPSELLRNPIGLAIYLPLGIGAYFFALYMVDRKSFSELWSMVMSRYAKKATTKSSAASEQAKADLNEPKKVSIIIPTFNREKYIRGAIESALKQTYPNYEVVVIDDGSSDGTRDIVMEYIRSHPEKIRYHYQANKGIPGSRNTGIKHAQGYYFLILDDDDTLVPEFLDITVGYLEMNNLDFVGPKKYYRLIQHGDDSNELVETEKPDLPKDQKELYVLMSKTFIGGMKTVFKKHIIKDAGLFDERLFYLDDLDLWLRLISSGYKFDFVPSEQPLLTYRVHTESVSNLHASDVKALVDKYVFYRKHEKQAYAIDRNLRKLYAANYWKVGRGLIKEKQKYGVAFKSLLLSLRAEFNTERISNAVQSVIGGKS